MSIFSKRAEKSVQKTEIAQTGEIPEESQEKPEGLSFSEIKERRKENIKSGISEAGRKIFALGGKIANILKRVGGGLEYVLVAPEAVMLAHEKSKKVDEKIEAGMDKAAEWTSEAASKAGEGIEIGVRAAGGAVKKGVEITGGAIKKGAEIGLGAVVSADEAVDKAMDVAAYWTSDMAGKGVEKLKEGGEFLGKKYTALEGWAGDKMKGFQERGAKAVALLKEKYERAQRESEERSANLHKILEQNKTEQQKNKTLKKMEKYERKAGQAKERFEKYQERFQQLTGAVDLQEAVTQVSA